MYVLQEPYKNTPTSPFENIHSSSTNQTLYTEPGVTYAQMNIQNSYGPTNIEQEPHIN
jgi:hypothetical protein